MADLDLLLEAERRGLLPEDKKSLLSEARARGLVPGGTPPSQTPAVSDGMPSERNVVADYARAAISPFAGVRRGAQDVTDTMLKYGARGIDVISPRDAGPSREEEIDAIAARQRAEYKRDYGNLFAGDIGRIGGQVVGTLPVGGLIAAPIKKAVQMAPSLARFLTPVATSIETGGFQTGLQPGVTNVATKAAGGAITRAAAGLTNVATKAAGGAITGAAAAEATGESPEVGGVIGAVVPAIVAPIVNKLAQYGRTLSDLKSTDLLKMMEGRGKDILASARSPEATIVPGATPHMGEVAAPVGSARFSAGIEKLRNTPGFETEKATQAAQVNEARLAQENRVQTTYQKQIDDVTNKIDSNLTEVNPYEVGSALTAAAKVEKDNLQKNVITPAYESAFELAGKAKVDISDVVKKAEDILGQPLSQIDPRSAPQTARALMSFKKGPTPGEYVSLGENVGYTTEATAPKAATANMRELDALRKDINADVTAARMSSDPMAATRLRQLEQLHATIDDAIGKSDTLPEAAKAAYAQAVNLYRTEMVPRFKTGVNANLFKQTSINEGKVRPEDVVQKYFNPNGASEAKQFVTLFGQNPDAMKIASTGIEDLFRQKVLTEAGDVAPEKVAAFMKSYRAPIAELDNAGMELTQKFETVKADAARLAEIKRIADASGNKLAPPLPPGSNALAIGKRIDELTKGMTPDQLQAVDAVRRDLARSEEYQRLVAAGGPAVKGSERLTTEAGAQVGIPTASFLNRGITVFNMTAKKLMGHMDAKLALELARELSNPTVGAATIEKALAFEAKGQTRNALARRAAPALALGAVQAGSPVNQNALSGQ